MKKSKIKTLPGESIEFDRLGRKLPSKAKRKLRAKLGGEKAAHSHHQKKLEVDAAEAVTKQEAAEKILALIGNLTTVEDCHNTIVKLTKAVISGTIDVNQANSAKGMIKECMKSLAEVQAAQNRKEARKSELVYGDIALLMYQIDVNNIPPKPDSSDLEILNSKVRHPEAVN